MPNPNKAKGSQFERDVRDYFQTRGIHGIKPAAGQHDDQGDLVVGNFALEIKNHSKYGGKLAGWITEAQTEAANADRRWGAVVHKRTGCGKAKMGDTFVTITLETLADLLGGE